MAVPALQKGVGELELYEEAVETGFRHPLDERENVVDGAGALQTDAAMAEGGRILDAGRQLAPGGDGRNKLMPASRLKKPESDLPQIIIDA